MPIMFLNSMSPHRGVLLLTQKQTFYSTLKTNMFLTCEADGKGPYGLYSKKRNVNGSVSHPMQCIPCCARHAIRTDIHLRNQDNAMQEP